MHTIILYISDKSSDSAGYGVRYLYALRPVALQELAGDHAHVVTSIL